VPLATSQALDYDADKLVGDAVVLWLVSTTGATLSEAAAELRISITTAKTHFSRIFSKTDVSRQADLSP
jgi:DNA-binding CsgD family transcriptional regulator